MKSSYQKTLSLVLCAVIFISSFMCFCTPSFAEEYAINDVEIDYTPFYFNLIHRVYLGEFSTKDESDIQTRDYREYDNYKVYDLGIVKKWSWLSNPYFIISVAKGATYERSRTIKTTINGTINGNIPSGAKSSVFKAFKMSASGSKTVSEKVTFSGPSGKAQTRDFYYQKGKHRHSVKVIREHRSNWDGVLWKKTYYIKVDVPAIRTYSEDH